MYSWLYMCICVVIQYTQPLFDLKFTALYLVCKNNKLYDNHKVSFIMQTQKRFLNTYCIYVKCIRSY